MKIKAFVTQGIHPEVIAISNSLGMNYAGRIAKGRNGLKENLKAYPE